jgi:hypothetical protein
VLVGFLLLLEKWMAGFFSLSLTHCRRGRMARAILNVAVVLTLPLAFVGTGRAQTCMVNSTADSGTGTLRSCLTNATSGTIVSFNVPSLSIITLASALPAISTNLILQGPGAQQLTISGASQYSVFTINAGTAGISGLTIANGNSSGNGGAILNSGTLPVSDSAFTGNTTSAFGGAIANAGTLTVSESSFAGNSSNRGAASLARAR